MYRNSRKKYRSEGSDPERAIQQFRYGEAAGGGEILGHAHAVGAGEANGDLLPCQHRFPQSGDALSLGEAAPPQNEAKKAVLRQNPLPKQRVGKILPPLLTTNWMS